MCIIHEQELCTEEAHAFSVAFHRFLCVLRSTDIAVNLKLVAIGSQCFLADELLELSLLFDVILAFDEILCEDISVRIDEYITGCTVNNGGILVLYHIHDARY